VTFYLSTPGISTLTPSLTHSLIHKYVLVPYERTYDNVHKLQQYTPSALSSRTCNNDLKALTLHSTIAIPLLYYVGTVFLLEWSVTWHSESEGGRGG